MRRTLVLDDMEKFFPEQYEFWKNKLFETNAEGIRKFFLGFREDCIEIYYKAMCVVSISYDRANNCMLYKNDPYYLEKTGKKSPLSFEDIRQPKIFESIISQIEKHVNGEHGVRHRHQREKDCQQWIVNENNLNSSEWFFLDIEYVYAPNPCGRIDMIAIKRLPNSNGKHELAFVELKVRHDEYNGIKTERYKKDYEKYEIAKKDIHNPEIRTLKYGSGIVSHIADYIRMLGEDNFMNYVREEVVEMIKGNVLLGLIDKDSELAKVCKTECIEAIPKIFILTYAYVPVHPGDFEKFGKIKSSKQALYNKIFSNGTEYGLSKMLRYDQISGFLENEKEFLDFIKDDDLMVLERKQDINGTDYSFVFEFVLPDKQANDNWKCLQA